VWSCSENAGHPITPDALREVIDLTLTFEILPSTCALTSLLAVTSA